jgi:hypothetical protein
MADEQRKPPRKATRKAQRKPRSKSTRGVEPPDVGDRYGRPGDDEGEAVEAHAEFVARHFGGGVEATPERLDRAIEVWQRLPGAVVRGPAQIRPNRPAVAASGDDEDTAS